MNQVLGYKLLRAVHSGLVTLWSSVS